MTSRKLLILSIAAIIAIGVGLWLASRQSASGSADAYGALYPDLKQQLSSVTAVRIFKAGDARAVELLRGESGWGVTERAGYPVDEAKLRKLLLGIADAKLYEQKTSNPDQYKSLGVEDVAGAAATGVRIELVGTPKPVNLIVGKSGIGAQSNYVRRAGEPESWLVNASIDTSSSPDAWLRKDIIDVSADRVQSAAVSLKDAKRYTAAKKSRADASFAVEGLPKGKELSSASAANGFAMALVGLTLTDVQAADKFESEKPAAHATFKTFDGLIADVDGWVRNDKHFIAIKTSFDASQAKQFEIPTAPAEDKSEDTSADKADAKADAKPDQKADAQANTKTDTGGDAKTPADAKSGDAKKPSTPSVEEEARTTSSKLAGWVYEIPGYKYDAIFKPVDELIKS